MKAFTNAAYLVKEGFAYQDGLFTGYDEAKRDYDRSSWDYEMGPDGFAMVGRDIAESALRLESAETARLDLHAGTRRAHLRHPQGEVPQGRADDRGDARRRPRR